MEKITAEKARELIKKIFENDELFFNKEFDHHFDELKADMQHDFIDWCKEVEQGNIPHTPITHKRYRDWILFIDKKADKRVLIVKVKNQAFIEVHLSGHKYYDDQRKRFGIKRGSRYY
ncbi:hypothetical protein JW930_06145 [Candidatus Woesearchaeota archaeon]|nr:hypothetical protein [Candidatus Woesearchaeota archaeon]